MRQTLIVIFILISQLLFGNNSKYFFEKISPGSGFAYDAITTIAEDSNGMVWFGCSNGLYYYNTSTIEKIELYNDTSTIAYNIEYIYKDNDSNIWVCTQKGLFKKNKYDNTFTKIIPKGGKTYGIQSIVQFNNDNFLIIIEGELYYFTPEDKTLTKIKYNSGLKTDITFLNVDNTGHIIFGTKDGCIFKGKHPTSNFNLVYKSISAPIKSICQDNNNTYIGYDKEGVVVIDHNGKKLYEINKSVSSKYHLPDNRVRDIIKTNNGEIWIGTYKGIMVIDDDENEIITSNKNTGLPFNSIYDFQLGINGGVWVGTWAGGLAYYKDVNYRFRHIRKVPNEKTESQSIISSFTEDTDGNILIGSEQSGINLFSNHHSEFNSNSPLFENEKLSAIKSFAKGDGKDIFIGTIFQGIWHYNSKLKKIKKLNRNISLDSSVISSIAYNKNGELWIASRSSYIGLSKYDFQQKQFIHHVKHTNPANSEGQLLINKLLFDSKNRLWLCTENGLLYKNENEDSLKRYFSKDSVDFFNNMWLYTILQDRKGDFWVGTRGNGVYKLSLTSGELIPIGKDNTLSQSDVYGIVQDNRKNIWLSTNHGIFSCDYNTNKLKQFNLRDGISGNLFNPNAIYSSQNGTVFFGSSNGFCFIDPNHIKTNSIAPDVFLSKLLINNKPINEKSKIETNSMPIGQVKNITLNYNQNSLTLGVVANNFIKPQKNKFRYRLINYQNEWVEIKHNKDITFTKIPSGEYTLEILGSNNDNLWSHTPLTIQIKILAPIWRRWYAVLLYLIVTLFLSIIVWRELNLKIKLRKEILTEKYKSEANKVVFDEKLRFFTNISHEIRTPLTLVISPLNSLLNIFQYDEKTTKHLLIIKRNSSRLLRLTNQILDFRLLEVGKLKANFKKTDIVSVCNDVLMCFEHQATEKQIELIFNSAYKSMWVTVDMDMIEKIIYNLVANALKFSNEKSQIFLSLENKDLTEESYNNYIFTGKRIIGKSIEIKVRDFGKGIKKEILPTIMDRFFVDPNEKGSGTGIGLHLCQEYAKLNNGNLLISSEEDKGSTFILNMPYQKNSEFIRESIVSQFSNFNNTNDHAITEDISSNKSSRKSVILLAEDNDELRSYLKDFLAEYYKVLTAKNGQQAFEIANEIVPDLLISDILMPVLSGNELVQKIKDNKKTSAIPIVILTALSESKYQKESLMKGVDSYLTKPVDETLLLAQIENILTKVDKVSRENELMKQQHNYSSTAEPSLIKKLETIVETNLRNSNFKFENVLKELHISKSTLHRKIKAYSNQSPTEFVRDIRLTHAVKLMKSQKYNIDEIGTLVGFNSTSYFIRSFKKKYGTTPKEYRFKIKEAKNINLTR
ncbi:hybrid sensor histidine kinase/response regulator transcription factor [Saccharicrinis sp. GN24d3]|uniref:hybrid sensor histidine kinase/response regulator transcription factor n=1 Tax=Saccharicrinis sp. GN24d3 TaxID=3458416 RepID=UPI00403695E7